MSARLAIAVAAGVALAGAAFAAVLSDARAAPGAQASLVFYLRGVPAGEERWTRTDDTTQVHLVIDRGPGTELRGTIVRRGGGPVVALSGRRFPWAVPDAGPVPAALPVAALAEFAARADDGGPASGDATVKVSRCGTHTLGGAALRCQAIVGAGWGAALLWRDAGGEAAAAYIPTPLGGLVGVRPSAAADTVADSVLSIAARVTLARIADRLPPAAPGDFAIVGAGVVTMADSSPRESVIDEGTIVVRNGLIATVGEAQDVDVPAAMRRIDGRGLTVLPGLWDSHAHLKQAEWLPAYLAAGVTTVRDLGGDAPFLLSLRRAADAHPAAVGPRILAAGFINAKPAGTRPYTSAAAATPDEARALVRRYRRAGYELIKLWNALDEAVAAAAIAEAHAAGMRVTWHVADGLGVESALAAGVDEINHVWSVLAFGDAGFRSSDAGRALLQRVVRRGVVVDPTLVVAAYQARLRTEPLVRFEPCAAWMPSELVRAWAAFGAADDGLAAAREQLGRAMRAVKTLHDAGAPIVAGSDQGIPGCTLVRELELYVEAGLTPFEALRSATVTPARVWGMLGRVGTVEAGKAADLVVVGGDPLASVSALRDVRLVVRAGRVLYPADLREAAHLLP